MTKSVSSISYDYEATSQDLEKFKRAIEYLQGRLYHNRAKGGYNCHCTRCGQDFFLTDEQMRQTKEAELCFYCAKPVKVVLKRPTMRKIEHKWMSIMNEKAAENGYDVLYERQGYDIRVIGAVHVLHHGANEATYVNGIVKNLGYSLCYSSKNYWRKERTSYCPYLAYFSSVDEIMAEEWKRKKGYYLGLKLAGKLNDFKSNQLTFIKKGIYNENQLKYINVFDLNYPEDLHKYNRYISIHQLYMDDNIPRLSSRHLEYLDKNNYSLREYLDYMNGCKLLGIKPGKPANLTKAHNDVMSLIKVKEDELINKQIVERHDILAKKEWTKGALQIHVFNNFYEMETVATKLKNCIAKMYAKPYAAGRTDVYYGTENGNITFAFEIAQNKLIQLRGYCNGPATEPTKKFVKEWCKKYEVSYTGE